MNPESQTPKEWITLSHTMDGNPLHRVRHRIVLFHQRYDFRSECFEYLNGFIKDNIHFAQIIKIEPVHPGDEKYTDPNHLIEVIK